MTSSLVLITFWLALCGGAGCARTAVKPATPPTTLGPESRFQKERHEPVLVAPPPSYGNKIVRLDVTSERADGLD